MQGKKGIYKRSRLEQDERDAGEEDGGMQGKKELVLNL